MLHSLALFVLAFQPSLAARGGVTRHVRMILRSSSTNTFITNLGTFNFVDAFIGVLAIAAIWLPGLAQAESKRIAGLPRNGVPAGRSDMQKAFVGKTEPRV